MAKPRKTHRKKRAKAQSKRTRFGITALIKVLIFVPVMAVLFIVTLFSVVNPPQTPYMRDEAYRLGQVRYDWVDYDDVAPVFFRSVIAAEDANFCLHWGLDVDAIKAAVNDGAARGASTISQQVVKNLFLWPDRSWSRKAIEAVLTPLTELIWSKRRIIEVYVNIAEFGEGNFGVEAAARHYFGISADRLTAEQSARLASVLPAPKFREPSGASARRVRVIANGADLIANDGRAACLMK